MKFGVGQAILRKEDDPLLRGKGHYVADYTPAGALHGYVVRSPQANAKFKLDASKARSMPGVKLILTAEDTADLGYLPCSVGIPGQELYVPPYPILVGDQVRHVGDAMAFIVAETLNQARDAAEAIEIDWDSLPAAIGLTAALAEGAPRVWPDRPNNLVFENGIGDREKTAEAFSKAARVVEIEIVNQRVVANFLDTRGAIGEYDPAQDRYTLTLSSQGPHNIRDVIAKTVLKVPLEKMRVKTPDVGGGFGTKLFPYREYALVAVAAKKVGKPVKWIADRTEHFLGDTQGRDNLTRAKMALDEKGRFLALQVDLLADMGAYLSRFAPYIPNGGATMLPGIYDIPVCFINVRAVYTNTVPVDAYRGAGRPEAAYVIERLVDACAREMGMGPDAIRKKNFIKPKAMPYKTPTGKTYDTGEFTSHMTRAQEIADWDGFKKRAAASKRNGKLRGIGLATYIEACGDNGPDTARVVIEKDGSATVYAGSMSNGQGHATAYAQIVADQLDLPPERVRTIQGDTDLIATGKGTGGSSSIPAAGASVSFASHKLADQLKALAAEVMEAKPDDMEIVEGAVHAKGTNRFMSFADLANHPKAKPEQLTASDAFVPKAPTFPNGTHIVEVEVDPDTGRTEIVNYVVVDDFGVTLNPMLLKGQVEGGAAQGIGQALLENTVYDPDSGQLVTATFMDYAMPRASHMKPITFETRNVPCKVNPLGVKGAGEAGAIGSCPAVINAVVDALWRNYSVRNIDMPATPAKVWAAIEEGKRTLRM